MGRQVGCGPVDRSTSLEFGEFGVPMLSGRRSLLPDKMMLKVGFDQLYSIGRRFDFL
jgi:hypothetical protein